MAEVNLDLREAIQRLAQMTNTLNKVAQVTPPIEIIEQKSLFSKIKQKSLLSKIKDFFTGFISPNKKTPLNDELNCSTAQINSDVIDAISTSNLKSLGEAPSFVLRQMAMQNQIANQQRVNQEFEKFFTQVQAAEQKINSKKEEDAKKEREQEEKQKEQVQEKLVRSKRKIQLDGE